MIWPGGLSPRCLTHLPRYQSSSLCSARLSFLGLCDLRMKVVAPATLKGRTAPEEEESGRTPQQTSTPLAFSRKCHGRCSQEPHTSLLTVLDVVILVTKSCPTLCDPMGGNPPDSSVHGISQARRILKWVAISFSRGTSDSGMESQSPVVAGGLFTAEPPGKPVWTE